MSNILSAIEQGRAHCETRIDRDIERNRKGDFSIRITKNGLPLQNAKIEYKLKKIDFDFGCNIFMLGQYSDKASEELYLKQWKNLFNTAVVPLYWEGTEPEQGKLRYSAKVDNDVYRRPPVDMVVDYCQQNGIAMKGHPLFWHEFIPQWLPEDWDELYPLIEKRFREISDRYADSIAVFDCLNEPSRLFDLRHEIKQNPRKCIFPPEGYIEQVFALGETYFPNNTLILNEATGAALEQFRGIYGSYYLLLEKLLLKGVKIDRIGLQCHVSDAPQHKNLFNGERFYELLDGYASLGKPLVLSEIGLSCSDEEIQAIATEQIYKICFSHEAMSGVFWWNLDDNGILTQKSRVAGDENLPHGGLCRNGRPKAAYKVLDRLINTEWTTAGSGVIENGRCEFRGFFGTYEITLCCDGQQKQLAIDLTKDNRDVTIDIP